MNGTTTRDLLVQVAGDWLGAETPKPGERAGRN